MSRNSKARNKKQKLCPNIQQDYKKLKNFTNTGILDPLFTHHWTLPTDFALMQVNAGSNLPISNYILPNSYER